MRFYCEAYEVITEEKKVSFFYVDEKPLRYLLFDYIFLLVLAKKKYPNLMNCTPKVRFIPVSYTHLTLPTTPYV